MFGFKLLGRNAMYFKLLIKPRIYKYRIYCGIYLFTFLYTLIKYDNYNALQKLQDYMSNFVDIFVSCQNYIAFQKCFATTMTIWGLKIPGSKHYFKSTSFKKFPSRYLWLYLVLFSRRIHYGVLTASFGHKRRNTL